MHFATRLSKLAFPFFMPMDICGIPLWMPPKNTRYPCRRTRRGSLLCDMFVHISESQDLGEYFDSHC